MTEWPDTAMLWMDLNRYRPLFGLRLAFYCAFTKSRFTATCAHCGKREQASRHGRWDRFAASQGWTAATFEGGVKS